MLKQILKDMFVDPEILAELPEEQKQILFFKIREEQKRRWEQHDKEHQKKAAKKSANKKKKEKSTPAKKVRVLEDSNSQPWTWVMGEHPNDVPVEEIWANLGNKDWKPSKRGKNQPPVSKVQALIFAQNKNQQESRVAKNTPEIKSRGDVIDGKNTSNNINNNNSVKTGSPKSGPDRITSQKPTVPASKPKIEDLMKAISQPVKIPQQVTKKPQIASSTHLKPASPSTPPALPGRPPSASPSTTRRIVPKSASPPKPATSEKSPLAPVKKTVPKVTASSSSDDDPYENMKELADKLPAKELGDQEWKTQLKRFKAADERRSFHARKASMQIKRLSQQNLMQEKKLKDLRTKFERQRSQRELIQPAAIRPALPPKPTNLRPKHPVPRSGRETKPASRKEAEDWFKETQTAEILASVDDNNTLPKWFHGFISRAQAESLLENRKVGDFLIRVSDKIWGYALSYKDENKIKHFLVDASETNCYHFFGNDQIRHPGLEQLIAFHQDEPISYGGEMLKNEVGQADQDKPDYGDLIEALPTDVHINKATNDTAF